MIVGFTIMTDPEYRQDPYKESIKQALLVFDRVAVVCGREEDVEILSKEFYEDVRIGALVVDYLEWPQPEWSYDELPKHLNHSLKLAKEMECDWAVKFDLDNFIHEKDGSKMRSELEQLKARKIAVGRFEKYQFFKPLEGYEKGKMSLALNMDFDFTFGVSVRDKKIEYTDLCQPLLVDKDIKTINLNGIDISAGNAIKANQQKSTGVHVWNYDYTFKEYDRSKSLLYYFDLSHAKVWGKTYAGHDPETINPDTSMNDYLKLARSRYKKCIKKFKVEDHPKNIKERIKNISPDMFGHNLWLKEHPHLL